MSVAQPKTKALVVATRCSSVEQFVSTFFRFCDDSTFFVATLASRPVGLETAFSIQLEDKTPVLRGLCTVVEAWATPANRFGRPGVRLAVKRLTNESIVVFKQLQVARKAAEVADAAKRSEPAALAALAPPVLPQPAPIQPPPMRPPIPRATPPATPIVTVPARVTPVRALPVVRVAVVTPVEPAPVEPAAAEPTAVEPDRYAPEPIAASDDLTNPVATETRTPGSTFILPANPLMNLTDKSLEGFVDCALYEETGNFFRAPEYADSQVDELDDLMAPPAPQRQSHRTLSPVPALRPNAFVPPSRADHDFAPETTPLPQLAGLTPSGSVRAETPVPMPDMPRGGRAPTPPVYDASQGMFAGEHTQPSMHPSPRRSGWSLPAEPHPAAMLPRVTFESTASLIALNRKRQRQRKRWLVIGGVAVGISLLLLITVLANRGGDSDAATPAREPSAALSRPAIASAPKRHVETPAPPAPKVSVMDPVNEPAADPDGPPVAGSGPCRVTVTSSPAGSMVQVDDQPLGPSPITIAGPCARRKIDVKHPRYALGTRWVTLSAGKPETVDIALARPTHSVTVTSQPSGATVSIAGRRAGTTPTAVKVMGFTGVTVTVEKPGFKTVTQKLYSKLDGDRISVKLMRGR